MEVVEHDILHGASLSRAGKVVVDRRNGKILTENRGELVDKVSWSIMDQARHIEIVEEEAVAQIEELIIDLTILRDDLNKKIRL